MVIKIKINTKSSGYSVNYEHSQKANQTNIIISSTTDLTKPTL